MTRTEPFYIKFDKINEMLKNTTDHTPTNDWFESKFQYNFFIKDSEN